MLVPSRRTEIQQLKEDAFTCDLFDAAPSDAMSLTKIPEDRDFLLAQREKGRRGCLGGIDMKLHDVEKRRYDREQKENKRRKSEEARVASGTGCQLPKSNWSSGNTDKSGTEDESDFVYENRAPHRSVAKKHCTL